MMTAMLAITFMDRVGYGVLAALLALVMFICWLFVLLFFGRLWRKLVRPRRQQVMKTMIACMLLASLFVLFAVPSRGYEFEGSEVNGRFLTLRKFGVTAWMVKQQTEVFSPKFKPAAASTQTSTKFSVVGLLAAFPAVIMLTLLARWLSRELPRFYRLPDDRCDACGYSMTGIRSPVCPECGEPIG